MSTTSFNSGQLSIDIKAADRLRQWFAGRGNFDGLKLNSVSLGDSDIDYRMSTQQSRIKVLQAPFNTQKIKTRLYYTGGEANLTGTLTMYLRRVNDSAVVESLYTYPPFITFIPGIAPPLIGNALNYNAIPFDTGDVNREGFICFIQTIPDGFFYNSEQHRLKETYTFVFNNVPNTWEVILDQVNGSFFIAKPAGYTFLTLQGSIQITGNISTITKTFLFNY
jgi:hypothetical protein